MNNPLDADFCPNPPGLRSVEVESSDLGSLLHTEALMVEEHFTLFDNSVIPHPPPVPVR